MTIFRKLTIPKNTLRKSSKATLLILIAIIATLAMPTVLTAEVYGGIDFPQGRSSFADAVLSYDPNFTGGPQPTTNTNPDHAIGIPDGPNVSLGRGGLLELLFTDNLLTNSGDNNADIHVFEVGPDVEETNVALRPLPETLNLLTSAGHQPDNGFFNIGKISGATSSLDIDSFFNNFPAGELQFDAVRLIDVRNQGDFSGATVGADINAVGAVSSQSLVGSVRVIASGEKSSTDLSGPNGPAELEETIELKEDAILTISSFGTINYNTPSPPYPNAGMTLRILIDGLIVAVDQDFEDETGGISFFSSASYSTFLKAGTYTLKVQRFNLGAAQYFPLLRMSYYAVAARDESN